MLLNYWTIYLGAASLLIYTVCSEDIDSVEYNKLKRQNEILSRELSTLRARVKYLSSECTCPDQSSCVYGGKNYSYRDVFSGGECERCSCLEKGEVQCRFDESIPGCKDECAVNPCYNGGTCSQGSNGYHCICPPDCTGTRCEVKDTHVCFLPIDKGIACDTAGPSVIYYFEPTIDDCATAEYLGCGGNSNRYSTYADCKASCVTGACCIRTLLREDLLYGHSPTGYDRYGYKAGYNEQGETATVKTATNFGTQRYRFQGVDYKGYRSDGYNKDRYSRSGYDCEGVDSNFLNEDGLSTGFSYSCDIVSKAQCMHGNDGSSLRTEVTSFTVGAVDCIQDVCHNSSVCRGCMYNGQHYEYEELFSNGCHRCICTRFGSVQCICSQVAERKEVRDMTAAEIADYQRAVRKLYSQGKWTEYSEMYERHLPHSHSTGLNFLAWHRAMLSELEMALQSVAGSCSLTIPYFDWTLDVGAMLDSPIWRAGLFGGDGADNTSCVNHHAFRGDLPWSPCLRRVFNSSVALPDAVAIEKIRRTSDFSSLSNQLTSASFLFRLWVGGHAETRNIIYDPVVVSHYAFIDKLWHEWQQRGDNYINLESFTRYRPLEPFGLSLDDVNSSPLQLCVDYAPLNSLCVADGVTAGRPYNLARPEAFNADGYDSAGFDRLGYNRQGYNGDGFDTDGYDIFGYDRYGFNKEGISKLGVTRTGEMTTDFDSSVLDKQNYTRLGIDIRGLDFGGRDIFGYDTRGYDSDGCNGHYYDGYHYVKQKFELDLELSTLEDKELDRISRLCSDLSFPRPWIFISSWVIVDPTHRLRGNPLALTVSTQVPEANLWVPDGPDSRFCVELKIYSSCDLGEKVRHDRCTGLDLCANATCPSYGTEAICRTVGCDNSCRKEWYHHGMVVTSSCLGCMELASGITYREGETWLAIDGCSRCQCIGGVSKCSGCPTVTCSHPDVSGCCPTCAGCSYEGKIYNNQAVFTSQSRPCDHCQCRDGTVTCVTRQCPSLDGCREPLTLAGACCAICLSCGARRNGDRWNEDACSSCECIDGRVKCSRIDCGPDRCSHPISVSGVCCPQCNACSYQGSYYNDGQVFSPDGCQSCVCNRGNIACTPASCPPTECSDAYTPPGECCPQCQDGCDYSGNHYENGDVFSPSFNPCMNCSCMDHKIRCGNVYCPPLSQLNCSRPIALPGDCCPSFCPSCVFEGHDYGHGNRWRPANRPCEQCICYNGVVSCRTSRRCDRTCSYGVYAQGECCSQCTDCEVDGEIYRDGSSFTHVTSDGCSECICRGGNVQCSIPTISCPTSDCVKPIQIPDTCCPRCPQCSNGKSHGERWRNELNQCEICECRDELVACYEQPCPEVSSGCVTLLTVDGQCCPSCMDCVADDGRLIVNGTSFDSSTDVCSTCTCVNQEISCTRLPCPQLWCNNPVTLPGQCCPICTGCRTSDGVIHHDGDRFVPDNDPCASCVCQEGELECKGTPCPPLACDTEITIPGSCCPTCGECTTTSGALHLNGESFISEEDACSQCNCTDGTISCRRKSCPTISCDEPVMLPDKCCPVCVTRQCDYNGGKLADGESIEVGCKQCKCEGGRVVCTTSVCPAISCLHPVMGACCPLCTDCLYDGQQLTSGSHITYNDTCTNCTCLNGTVSCVHQTCPDIDCNFPAQDGCCSSCSNGCSYGGLEYEQGESFVSASDPCETCICMDGDLTCDIKECSLPGNCPSAYKPDGECCEICSGCVLPATALPTSVHKASNSFSGKPPLPPPPASLSLRSRRSSNVIMIEDGYSYYDESDCTNCACDRGSITCLPVGVCPTPPCSDPRTDGCCPSCSGCSYANNTLMPGEVMPKVGNTLCEECMCNSGSMDCYKLCPPTFCPGRTKLDDCGCELCDDELICTHGSNSTVTYKSGEKWLDENNCPCVCESGETRCEGCQLNLQCPYTEVDADSCCGHRCKGCSVNQIHYTSGATWSPDGCMQTCTCHGGIVTCIEKLYRDDNCANIPLQCYGDNLPTTDTCCDLSSISTCTCQGPQGSLSVGEAFKPNNTDTCAVCTCVQGVTADVTYLECYEPVCPDVSDCPADKLYYPDADSCCPLCKQQLPYECTERTEGEVVEPLYATCEQCLCTNNTWTCSPRTCPDIDCPPSERLTQPGECCPTCAGCYTDVVRKAHGSSWQHDTDPCATCKCSYGDVICERTVVCPPLFCTQGRKPFTPVGECCQACGEPVTGDDCLDSRGSTRPHGSGWPIDDCTLCVCLFGKVNCTVESCPYLDCKSDETLVIEEGVCCPSCVKQPALCKVYGDPHYKTFDGETLHFQGFCSYEMVKDCVSETFNLIAIHDDRSTKSVSWIKGVVIVAGGLSIKLGQGLWSEVNGVNVTFPFQHQSGLAIRLQPTTLQVYSETLGFKFTWDGAAYGEVEADTKLKNKLCGLCGNFNDNPKDELTQRDGTLVTSHSKFGDSWIVEGSECSAVTSDINPCDAAGYEVKKRAIEQCAIIQGELFAPCHRAVAPDDYVFACVYDMCACNSTADCLCDVLTAYSAACRNSYVRIQWRTHDRCALNCDAGKGLLFDECGPKCPRTCENYNKPLGELDEECLKPCEPSCQCPAGLLLHNNRCITHDLCP